MHWSEKSKLWKQIGAMESNARKWLPHRDVMKRRDVGSTNTEVNNLKRRDASTSRRLNVATLQRHDVSSRSAPHHLKYEGLRNRGNGEAYERGHRIPEQSDTDFEEVPGICTVSHFFVGY